MSPRPSSGATRGTGLPGSRAGRYGARSAAQIAPAAAETTRRIVATRLLKPKIYDSDALTGPGEKA